MPFHGHHFLIFIGKQVMSFFQGKRPVKEGYPEKTGTRDVRRSGKYLRQDDRQKRFVSPDEQWVYLFRHPFSGRFLRTECGSIVRCGHGWQEVSVIRPLLCLPKEGFGREGFIQACLMSDYVPFEPNVHTVFY